MKDNLFETDKYEDEDEGQVLYLEEVPQEDYPSPEDYPPGIYPPPPRDYLIILPAQPEDLPDHMLTMSCTGWMS